jgi:putative ABC transport system permease protein
MTGMIGGVLTSWGVTEILRNSNMPMLTYIFPTSTVIFSVVICTIIGLGFGIYPAWRAANLDPIEALRYE